MDIATKRQVSEIRRLNDQFRTTFRGGTIVLTSSVAELPDMVKAAALCKLREYEEFEKDADPRNEHDFLTFELCNRHFIFHIAYYDMELKYGSPDPTDPTITKRIGCLMLASDW